MWKISIWCMSVISSLQMLIPCFLQLESRCQHICERSFLRTTLKLEGILWQARCHWYVINLNGFQVFPNAWAVLDDIEPPLNWKMKCSSWNWVYTLRLEIFPRHMLSLMNSQQRQITDAVKHLHGWISFQKKPLFHGTLL